MRRNHLVQLLFALSQALDLVGGPNSSSFSSHGLRVAYIGGRIAERMGLSALDKEKLFFASLVHDIGVSSSAMHRDLVQFEVINPDDHCIRGADLLTKSDLLRPIAPIIRRHHAPYCQDNDGAIASIIHLADRTAICILDDVYIVHQRDKIMERIQSAAAQFCPAAVAALVEVAKQEAFWLDTVSLDLIRRVERLFQIRPLEIDLGTITQLAKIFAEVIDDKSTFTAEHSWDVTRVALALSERLGFTVEQLQQMQVAALLHDLGKLGVDDAILDKHGPLTQEEMAVMKMHTYHTYHLLAQVDGLEEMARWGAYHHERLDGRGYPFRLGAEHLDLGSRIVAVSDVFSALRQHRPYRSSMPHEKTREILLGLVANGGLDARVADTLLTDYTVFTRLVHTGD